MADQKLIAFLEWFLEKCERSGSTRFARNRFISLLMDRDGLNFEKKIRPRINYLKGKAIIEESKSIGNVLLYDVDIEHLKKELYKLHNDGESNDSP